MCDTIAIITKIILHISIITHCSPSYSIQTQCFLQQMIKHKNKAFTKIVHPVILSQDVFVQAPTVDDFSGLFTMSCMAGYFSFGHILI